ncbi:hypothetical protein GI374_04475 [Paracoccus sp. S-4012]|uniref:sulfotransferase family 2 domain-containing protein n=1 Tax=Paracoccus sp. S-4012 TaxID=2665648 RepID=UPI0012B0855C|nr:sulfotransferase family 2 domain-containing protein [Paracoccus sp. S-4012]MRX49715.1 hypothetical protein [Paracoccus sp. S-4012]
MSNFLLKDPDCVFIHIPKTGGTSIRKGAWSRRVQGPRFGHIPPEWDGLFRFAFTREPLDRFLSVWRMFTIGPEGDPDWSLPPDARPLSLDEFFDIVRDDSIIFDERRRTFEEKIRHHAIPQTHPFNCLRQADFIGRFETIAEDYRLIAERVGQTARLPRLHVTARGPADAEATLSPKLAAAVRDYYSDDYRFLETEVEHYRALA